jgi:hypothetical protein
MDEPKNVTLRPKADRRADPDASDTHRAIARRAYELYVARGKTPGHALDDWLQAERELSTRH